MPWSFHHIRKMVSILVVMMVLLIFASSKAIENPSTYIVGNLTYVILEDGTAEITKYTGTESEIIIPDTLKGALVTSIGPKAFRRNYTTLSIPASIKNIDGTALSMFERVFIDPDNQYFTSEDGIVFDKAKKTLLHCHIPDKVYQVPDGIETIGKCAFAYSSLEYINLPDSVTTISDKAFTGCQKLKTVSLPATLKTIGDYAFSDCWSMQTIDLPDNLNAIRSRGFSMFF